MIMPVSNIIIIVMMTDNIPHSSNRDKQAAVKANEKIKMEIFL